MALYISSYDPFQDWSSLLYALWIGFGFPFCLSYFLSLDELLKTCWNCLAFLQPEHVLLCAGDCLGLWFVLQQWHFLTVYTLFVKLPYTLLTIVVAHFIMSTCWNFVSCIVTSISIHDCCVSSLFAQARTCLPVTLQMFWLLWFLLLSWMLLLCHLCH